MLAQVDTREQLAELAANVRYTMYAKKVKPKQLFDKRKQEKQVKALFNGSTPRQANAADFAQRVQAANDYFYNKNRQGENNE